MTIFGTLCGGLAAKGVLKILHEGAVEVEELGSPFGTPTAVLLHFFFVDTSFCIKWQNKLNQIQN